MSTLLPLSADSAAHNSFSTFFEKIFPDCTLVNVPLATISHLSIS